MPLAQVEEMAAACHVAGDAPLLLKLLNALGMVNWYDEPNLRHVVFLQPQWLVDRMSRVIRNWQGDGTGTVHPHPAMDTLCRLHQRGLQRFIETATATRPLLTTMITADDRRDGPPDDAEGDAALVIGLMEKMALLAEVNNGTYLVPSLLRPSLPAGCTASIQDGGETLQFALQFDGFIADGFWERTLCRCMHRANTAYSNSMPPNLSQSQALLSFGPHQFLMELLPNASAPCIKITVQPKKKPKAVWIVIRAVRDMALEIGRSVFKLGDGMIRTQLYVTGEHAAWSGGAADAAAAKAVVGTVPYAMLRQAAQSGDKHLWTTPLPVELAKIEAAAIVAQQQMLAAAGNQKEKEYLWDVFISYNAGDMDPVYDGLLALLTTWGLKAWHPRAQHNRTRAHHMHVDTRTPHAHAQHTP